MAEHITIIFDPLQLATILSVLKERQSDSKLDQILDKLNSIGEIVMGNKEALQALTDEINNEVVPILQDLAAKAAGGADVSQGLTDLAASLKSSAEAADPGFVPPAPPTT